MKCVRPYTTTQTKPCPYKDINGNCSQVECVWNR